MSRDSAGVAQPHVTGAAGRGVSFLQRAPQRLGLSTAGPAVLTQAPRRSPSARLPAAQLPDPARLPLRRPSCPWRPPAAPGGSRCSCCYSVRSRADRGSAGRGRLQGSGGLRGRARRSGGTGDCGMGGCGRLSSGGGATTRDPGAAGLARGRWASELSLHRPVSGVDSPGRCLWCQFQLPKGRLESRTQPRA